MAWGYALGVEIGIILTIVLIGLVAGDVALVRAISRRGRGGGERDAQRPRDETRGPKDGGE